MDCIFNCCQNNNYSFNNAIKIVKDIKSLSKITGYNIYAKLENY